MTSLAQPNLIFTFHSHNLSDQKGKRLSDDVFDYIINELCKGKYRPGDRLNERMIASELNVSHVPVREAMERFIGMGWMVRVPQRGVILKKVTTDELMEIYDLRYLFESHAIQIVAPKITKAQVKKLYQFAKQMQGYDYKSDDMFDMKCFYAEYHFHEHIIRFTGNQKLIELALPVLLQTFILFHINFPPGSFIRRMYVSYIKEGDHMNELVAHDKIVKDLAAHRVQEAIDKTQKHVINSRDINKRVLAEFGGLS